MSRILGIIPARGGSKGIKKKNIKIIAGKPLIQWTIDVARQSKYISELIVSTEDTEIANLSLQLGASVPFLRPTSLACDDSKTIDVINYVVDKLETDYNKFFDYIIILQPTSPLRTLNQIDDAVEMILKDKAADSLVSCIKVPHIFHPESIMKLNENNYLENYTLNKMLPTRRQDKSVLFARNGAAIYITKRNKIKEFIFGGNLLCYEMPIDCSIDIDNMEDFVTAEKYLLKRGV